MSEDLVLYDISGETVKGDIIKYMDRDWEVVEVSDEGDFLKMRMGLVGIKYDYRIAE